MDEQVVFRLLQALSGVTLNYGLRARCGEVLGITNEPLSKEVLEARERGALEAYMAALEVLSFHSETAAEHLAFIRFGPDEEEEGYDAERYR